MSKLKFDEIAMEVWGEDNDFNTREKNAGEYKMLKEITSELNNKFSESNGYANICPGAYSGCHDSKDKNKFNSECIDGMNRYVERGSCNMINDALSPILNRGESK